MEDREKRDTEMTEEENVQEDISQRAYIYSPPLFDSVPLVEYRINKKKKGWGGLNLELGSLLNSMKVKGLIRSLPCLFGPSIKQILLYADALFWRDPTHVLWSAWGFQELPETLFRREIDGFWTAQRFCPVLIGRAPGPAKNKTAVMVLYSYEIVADDDPAQYSNPLEQLGLGVTHDQPILLSSLSRSELESVIPRLHLKISAKLLQRILLSQVALLYGAVPSFIYYGREDDRDDGMSQTAASIQTNARGTKTRVPLTVEGINYPPDLFWDGGNSKAFLHPTVAHWWMLALSYQARYLANGNPAPDFPWDHYAYEEKITDLSIQGHVLTKIQYHHDLEDFYPEQTGTHSDSTEPFWEKWEIYLRKHLLSSMARADFLMTHHIFSADQEKPTFEWDPCSKEQADAILHASNTNYSCANLRDALLEPYEQKLPPIPLPVRLFRQSRNEHEMLTQGLSDACLAWANYTQENSSRLFFTAAFLYASYQNYYPVSSPTEAKGVQVFDNREKCLFLVIDDPAALAPKSDSAQAQAMGNSHPLGQSCEFWHTEHVSPRTSIRTVASRMSKVTRKMCIILFDGATRDLSPTECDMLLCSADIVVLGNVSLPPKYHALHLSVSELGIPCEEESACGPAFPRGTRYFPTRHDFAFLQLAVTRALFRYMWYEFNQRCFHLNLASHDKFLQSASYGPHQPDYEYLLIKSMRYSKVEPKDALHYFKRIALFQYQSRTSAGKLARYLPLLISSGLLRCCYLCTDAPDVGTYFPFNPFSLEIGSHKKKGDLPVSTEKTQESGRMIRKPVFIRKTPEQQLIEVSKRHATFFAPHLLSASQQKKQAERLLENSYRQFLDFLLDLRLNHPDRLCRSKQEYLRRKAEGAAPLGWESEDKLYLDRELYWTAFCESIQDGDRLLPKRLAFLKNVLAPKVGDRLYRDDAKSGHWYCRFSIWENGKSKRIGSFLVLASSVTYEN